MAVHEGDLESRTTRCVDEVERGARVQKQLDDARLTSLRSNDERLHTQRASLLWGVAPPCARGRGVGCGRVRDRLALAILLGELSLVHDQQAHERLSTPLYG